MTVVVSMVSVTSVTAGTLLGTRFSKLPPVAVEIVASTLPASLYTSSAGAGTVTVPVVLPASIVITAPLDRVTVTGEPAALVKVAV
ncbi:hypothetical protein D3C87_1306690 [compost metagenome]